MTIHLFNPENDTALATDTACYTPSRMAQQLHADGSLLPLWWAKDGDIVLSGNEQSARKIVEEFHLSGKVSRKIEERYSTPLLSPWGWSRDARRQFIEAGVEEAAMPGDNTLGRIRELSHRRHTICINEMLQQAHLPYPMPPIPMEIRDIEELPTGWRYIKLPWSSSGRGVNCYNCSNLSIDEHRYVKGMIRRQGSVLVEKRLDKVMDFACLFHSRKGEVEYKGLSIFETDRKNVYTGNLVAPEEYLRRKLSKLIPPEWLDMTTEALENILSNLISNDYDGWVGIDMMIYRDDAGVNMLAPCIEMNLRMTMGVAAHLIAKNPVISKMLPALFTIGPKRGEIDLTGGSSEIFHPSITRLRNL